MEGFFGVIPDTGKFVRKRSELYGNTVARNVPFGISLLVFLFLVERTARCAIVGPHVMVDAAGVHLNASQTLRIPSLIHITRFYCSRTYSV